MNIINDENIEPIGTEPDYAKAFAHLAYIVGQLKHCQTERETAQLIMQANSIVEAVYAPFPSRITDG